MRPSGSRLVRTPGFVLRATTTTTTNIGALWGRSGVCVIVNKNHVGYQRRLWLLLASSGFSWLFLAFPGFWLFLASAGSFWLLLASPGFSWLLLAPPGGRWVTWLVLAFPGSSWLLSWLLLGYARNSCIFSAAAPHGQAPLPRESVQGMPSVHHSLSLYTLKYIEYYSKIPITLYLLLALPGSFWLLPAPPCSAWLLLAPPGSPWLLLAPPGSQDSPRWPQIGPKMTQDGLKMAPR